MALEPLKQGALGVPGLGIGTEALGGSWKRLKRSAAIIGAAVSPSPTSERFKEASVPIFSLSSLRFTMFSLIVLIV